VHDQGKKGGEEKEKGEPDHGAFASICTYREHHVKKEEKKKEKKGREKEGRLLIKFHASP